MPVAVMRTTAGLTLAAALTTADESSMAIGLGVWPAAGLRAPDPAGRFSAPVPSRMRTVPPEASTADSRAAPRIRPSPSGPVLPLAVTAGGDGFTGSAGAIAAGAVSLGSSQAERVHSGRGSGGGE